MTATNFSDGRNRAQEIIDSYAAGCAGTAVLAGPIPGTSALLTGIEAKMCYDIARAYGFHPTLQEASATIGGLVAASGILKIAAIEIATWVPFLGWAVKGGIAYKFCNEVGKLAMNHYEQKLKNS